MKNYRKMSRYQPHEWEEDKEWRARRLQFLWDMRSYYTSYYLSMGLAEEKEDFYDVNDSTVSRLAAKYNNYGEGEIARYERLSNKECSDELRRLERIKNSSKDEFVLKKNCNFYCYIVEQRLEDVRDYREDMGEDWDD